MCVGQIIANVAFYVGFNKNSPKNAEFGDLVSMF